MNPFFPEFRDHALFEKLFGAPTVSFFTSHTGREVRSTANGQGPSYAPDASHHALAPRSTPLQKDLEFRSLLLRAGQADLSMERSDRLLPEG